MKIRNRNTHEFVRSENLVELDTYFEDTEYLENGWRMRCYSKEHWIKVDKQKCLEEIANCVNKVTTNVKVRKPRQSEEYLYINDDGAIIQSRWTNDSLDNGRWELGNVFFTKESAWFAREKKKVEVELQRYAEEHNGTASTNRRYLIRYEEDEKRLLCDTLATAKIQGTVMFTSRDVLADAIEAVGKERIIKYIFGGRK